MQDPAPSFFKGAWSSDQSLRSVREVRAMMSSGVRQITAGAEGDSVCCSFCKKGPETVGVLIEGPVLLCGTPAYICQECVELCTSIFQRRRMSGAATNQSDESTMNAATQRLLEEKIDQ